MYILMSRLLKKEKAPFRELLLQEKVDQSA